MPNAWNLPQNLNKNKNSEQTDAINYVPEVNNTNKNTKPINKEQTISVDEGENMINNQFKEKRFSMDPKLENILDQELIQLAEEINSYSSTDKERDKESLDKLKKIK